MIIWNGSSGWRTRKKVVQESTFCAFKKAFLDQPSFAQRTKIVM